VESSVRLGKRPRLNTAGQVALDGLPIRGLEEGLEAFANLIAVSTGHGVRMASPLPEVFFSEVSQSDRDYLNRASGLALTGRSLSGALWTVPFDATLARALADREDGAALIAEALSSTTPSGRFRDLLRVMERAFGLGPFSLVEPVSEFLTYFDVLEYSEAEVSEWLTVLRHLITHADRRDEFALSRDLLPVLNRVQTAAYDILLNKATWRDAGIDRRRTWHPPCGVLADNTTVVIVQGSEFVSEMTILDAFGSYPVDLSAPPAASPSDPSIWLDPSQSGSLHRSGTAVVVEAMRSEAPI
jgi:hypothetical protein